MDPDSPRDHLTTEQRNPVSAELDRLGAAEAFDLFQEEDERAARAVAAARSEVVAAIELIAGRLRRGGRLFYLGAGTSGRLAVLDAAECPPTFQSDPELVQGILAGGEAALTRAVEGAEDSPELARAALEQRGLGPDDAVFGITAGGTTAFVHGGLELARERGAATVFLACVPRGQVADRADVSIRLDTGPELLAGSTRLKAGTATKLVLNRVSTLVMVALGKVYGNLMVDVDTRANRKLTQRGLSILAALTGLPREACAPLLERAGGAVKVAAVMHAAGVDAAAARRRLEACGGSLRRALEGGARAGGGEGGSTA